MEELGVAAHHFLEPVPRAGAPGLAPQLVAEHVQIDVKLELHVREEERLAEADVGAVRERFILTPANLVSGRIKSLFNLDAISPLLYCLESLAKILMATCQRTLMNDVI